MASSSRLGRSCCLWALLGLVGGLVFAVPGVASPFDEHCEELLDRLARQDDRGAAEALRSTWSEDPDAARYRNASQALTEGLNGSPGKGRVMLSRDLAAHPEDASLRLASTILVLLEKNPRAARQALDALMKVFPESPSLYHRLSDVYQSAGELPPPMWRIPLALPPEAMATPLPPKPTPTPKPALAKASDSYEVRPVTSQQQREAALRKLSAAQQGHAPPKTLKPAASPRPLWSPARPASTPPGQAAPQAAQLAPTPAKASAGPAAPVAATPTRPPASPKPNPAWLAAERKRIEEATRQATEEQARQKARAKAEQAFLEAERQRRQEDEQQAKRQAELAYQAMILDNRRQEAQRRLEREQGEAQRWQAVKKAVPTPAPPVAIAAPDHPRPTAQPAGARIEVAKLPTNRRIWIGETRASVRARLGPPQSVEGQDTVYYTGLRITFDTKLNKVASYRNETGWYWGPGGIRAGMGLKEVLSCLPSNDGIFHLKPPGRPASASLYVVSTVDGVLVELQKTQDVWLSTWVEATTPGSVATHYDELTHQGPMRRVELDTVLSLESRRAPLP